MDNNDLKYLIPDFDASNAASETESIDQSDASLISQIQAFISSPAPSTSQSGSTQNGSRKRRAATTTSTSSTIRKTDLVLPKFIVDLPKEVLATYCDNINKRCQLCGEKYDTDRIYSVRRHLYRKHRAVVEEAAMRRENGEEQKPIVQMNMDKKPIVLSYPNADIAADLVLTNVFSTTSTSISLIDNSFFQRLLRMIPGFTPPTSHGFRQQLLAENSTFINQAATALINSPYCAVSSSVATDPYAYVNYLGIVVHYFDLSTNIFRNVAVSLSASDKLSSAEELEQTLHEKLWEANIVPTKVMKYVSTGQIGLEKELFTVEKALSEIEVFNNMNEEGPILPDIYGFDATLFNEDITEDYPILSSSLHCVSHRLELAMNAAYLSVKAMVDLKKTIFSVLELFSQTPAALLELKNYTSIKLLFPRSNSWPAIFATYKRVYAAFDGIQQVCANNGWQPFDDDAKELLQKIIDLFEPFLRFRKAVQADNQPTISLIHSGIHGLMEVCKALAPESTLAKAMKTKLDSQFADVLDENDSDPIYLAAAALDPRTFELVCKDDSTKDAIYKVLQDFGFEESFDLSPTANEKEMPDAAAIFGFDIPSAKKIKVEKKPSRTVTQITSFLNKIASGEFYNCPNDAGLFWCSNKEYPTLGKLAFSLLSIPATAINCEKLFGKLQLFTNSGRTSSNDEMFELRAMLAYNNNVGV